MTWFEGRRVVGVWGEQRARCAVDVMTPANAEATTVAVGLQDGTIALLGVGDAVSQIQAQLPNPPEPTSDAATSTATTGKSSSTSAPPPPSGPTAVTLPELARFHVALPPAPSEKPTSRGKLLRGAGGNRSIESAHSMSRFAGLGFFDDFSR